MGKKNLMSVLLVVAILLSMSNVFASGVQEESADEYEHIYQIGSGPTGGNFYPMAVGMQRVLRDVVESDYQTAVAVTGGSIDNGNQLLSGEVDLAILTQPNAASLYNGTDEWESRPMEDLTILTPLIPGHIRFVFRTDANVNTLQDIKGKRFSVGQTGGGGESFCRDAFQALGFTFDDFQNEFLDLNGIAHALKDGKLDGAAFAGSEPYAALIDLMTSMGDKIKIYDFTEKEIATITAVMPKYGSWVTKAGTYPNQPYDATIIAYHYYLAAGSELPEGLAYDLTKALNENQKWLSSIHSGYVNLDVEKAPSIMSMTDIPIHAGAMKYWKEVGAMK